MAMDSFVLRQSFMVAKPVGTEIFTQKETDMAKFLIVEARYYAHINDLMLEGVRGALEEAGHAP